MRSPRCRRTMATRGCRPTARRVCLEQMERCVCFCSSDTNHPSDFSFVCELCMQRDMIKSSKSTVVLFIIYLSFFLLSKAESSLCRNDTAGLLVFC